MASIVLFWCSLWVRRHDVWVGRLQADGFALAVPNEALVQGIRGRLESVCPHEKTLPFHYLGIPDDFNGFKHDCRIPLL